MINQDVYDFLNQIFCDWKFAYKDHTYFFDGYSDKNGSTLHVYKWKTDDPSGLVEEDIVFNNSTMDECKRDFLASKIFDGKTFWEVQDEMEYVDD